ncbi:unnamed protein product [Peronospora destructor]|uniref:Uncharacterized protein n=1 Tax=Peronospora destructor TaxID=86335 RepID=A0AAV0V852_9STRA|nr:unnamed protein product [Peronospora destructor]
MRLRETKVVVSLMRCGAISKKSSMARRSDDSLFPCCNGLVHFKIENDELGYVLASAKGLAVIFTERVLQADNAIAGQRSTDAVLVAAVLPANDFDVEMLLSSDRKLTCVRRTPRREWT